MSSSSLQLMVFDSQDKLVFVFPKSSMLSSTHFLPLLASHRSLSTERQSLSGCVKVIAGGNKSMVLVDDDVTGHVIVANADMESHVLKQRALIALKVLLVHLGPNLNFDSISNQGSITSTLITDCLNNLDDFDFYDNKMDEVEKEDHASSCNVDESLVFLRRRSFDKKPNFRGVNNVGDESVVLDLLLQNCTNNVLGIDAKFVDFKVHLKCQGQRRPCLARLHRNFEKSDEEVIRNTTTLMVVKGDDSCDYSKFELESKLITAHRLLRLLPMLPQSHALLQLDEEVERFRWLSKWPLVKKSLDSCIDQPNLANATAASDALRRLIACLKSEYETWSSESSSCLALILEQEWRRHVSFKVTNKHMSDDVLLDNSCLTHTTD